MPASFEASKRKKENYKRQTRHPGVQCSSGCACKEKPLHLRAAVSNKRAYNSANGQQTRSPLSLSSEPPPKAPLLCNDVTQGQQSKITKNSERRVWAGFIVATSSSPPVPLKNRSKMQGTAEMSVVERLCGERKTARDSERKRYHELFFFSPSFPA